jgi:two-component system OmpR family sensor kinase
MNGPARISLRARLVIVLITVTATFLLVLGVVTTLVLSGRLSQQFNADLVACAAHKPQDLYGGPGGCLAVAVSRWSGRSVLFTQGPQTTQLAHLIVSIPPDRLRQDLLRQPFSLTLADGTGLRAVGRSVPSYQVSGLPPARVLIVVARPLTDMTAQRQTVVIAELITGGALILLLALGGRWLIGRALAPLSQMTDTAQRITTQGDLTARMPDADGRTEVGRLGAAINTMLDRIQHAFGARLQSEHKVRQFAADASHELRTPLTTIRGYAELYRQGALGPGQLPDAMRRIEQEGKRMSTLVAELLELARLDRTSSLDIAETDLAVLVRDAVADARAVEPDRPVRAQAPATLVAAVDEARIRQVLANLLGNVRAHTPVSTPTEVRLGQVSGGVVVEVADAGPGMTPDEAARAFDRFYRASERANGGPGEAGSAQAAAGNGASRGADSGGSGLGLAIVAAIAQAHGGYATLKSERGHGTRVRVWLPTGTIAPLPVPVRAGRLSPGDGPRLEAASVPTGRGFVATGARESSATQHRLGGLIVGGCPAVCTGQADRPAQQVYRRLGLASDAGLPPRGYLPRAGRPGGRQPPECSVHGLGRHAESVLHHRQVLAQTLSIGDRARGGLAGPVGRLTAGLPAVCRRAPRGPDLHRSTADRAGHAAAQVASRHRGIGVALGPSVSRHRQAPLRRGPACQPSRPAFAARRLLPVPRSRRRRWRAS